MKTINLRDYYDNIFQDTFVDISDEVLEIFENSRKAEVAYRRNKYRHHAHYSLDVGDGIENDALFVPINPEELCQKKHDIEALHKSLDMLPEKQARRIYAYYFLGTRKSAIAKGEGISKVAVDNSIQCGLRNLKLFLKKID